VVGTLSVSDLVRAYRDELRSSYARLTDLAPGASAYEVVIADHSSVAGKRLRLAGLPRGVLVTSIAREGDVILPTGDTVLLSGDRLSVLGSREGMDAIGAVSSAGGSS